MESVMKEMPIDSRAAAKSYISEKNVPQLFESITAGLLHHKPKNALEFVQECIENVKDKPEMIRWNSFIDYTPTTRCMSASDSGSTRPSSRTKSPFHQDHKLPGGVEPSKKDIEAAHGQGYTKVTETGEGLYVDKPTGQEEEE